MKRHVICMCEQYCESLTYKHLSESSMYIILSELKLNQRKALSGLNNITGAGLSAINDITELVKSDQLALKNSEKKELLHRIKSWISYLKLKYCIICLKPCDRTNSHCPIFATSDSKCNELAEKYERPHNKTCPDCQNMIELFSQLKSICYLEKNKNICQNLLHVVNNYEEDVALYLKHMIRDCQQEKAKRDILQNIGDKDIFWIKDWSQKIFPRKFREPQQD